MRAVFLYHADAELDRALAIATAVALAALAVFTLWLTAIAPRKPGRPRRATAVALALAGAGIAAFVAMWAIPWSESEDEPPLLWWTLFVILAGAVFLAPAPAFVAFSRREGRLAGIAIGMSLVLPVLFVAGMIACGITDACFH
jgi:drug/metabolite transporter (DMT)-like permease